MFKKRNDTIVTVHFEREKLEALQMDLHKVVEVNYSGAVLSNWREQVHVGQ